MTTDNRPDPSSLSYEQARDELITIVRELEAGHIPLEATMDLWERGEVLATRCRSILHEARTRLNTVEQEEYMSEATN